MPRTLDETVTAESTFDDGHDPFVRIGRCDGWVFAWENASGEGVRPEVLRRLSRGTEVVVVRHVQGAEEAEEAEFDDDPLGMVLRGFARDHYVSEQYQLKGSATGWVAPEEQWVRAARADAVRAIRTTAGVGGEAGLAQVLAHRSAWAGPAWREQVIEGLRGADVPQRALDELDGLDRG